MTAVEQFWEGLKLTMTEGDMLHAMPYFEQAKVMEKEQQNNLPIHIHEGISNTHVYIEDGVVHVKPNETFKSE